MLRSRKPSHFDGSGCRASAVLSKERLVTSRQATFRYRRVAISRRFHRPEVFLQEASLQEVLAILRAAVDSPGGLAAVAFRAEVLRPVDSLVAGVVDLLVQFRHNNRGLTQAAHK
jgi:hypothetical protein